MAMPHKGPRDVIHTRPTLDVGLAVRREAAEHRMTAGEWVAHILAERYDLPATNAEADLLRSQQELPMTG